MARAYQKEASLVRWAREYLRARGWYVVKTAPPIEAGTPDLLACVGEGPNRGTFVGIEVKWHETNEPTKLQVHRLNQITAAGGVGVVVRSREDIRSLVGRLS